MTARTARGTHTTTGRGCQASRGAVPDGVKRSVGLAAMVSVLGCVGGGAAREASDAGRADVGCAWGTCAEAGMGGPRCVATGMADGSWLTADWSEDAVGEPCTAVPPELRNPGTPGSYESDSASIGELRCEGLRSGEATLRVRLRVRLLAAWDHTPSRCACDLGWNVGLRVLIDGRETTRIDGLRSDANNGDWSCRRGPEVTQAVPVTVGADGRVSVRVELGRCERQGPTRCVFLQGTGLSIEQRRDDR